MKKVSDKIKSVIETESSYGVSVLCRFWHGAKDYPADLNNFLHGAIMLCPDDNRDMFNELFFLKEIAILRFGDENSWLYRKTLSDCQERNNGNG